MTGEDLCNIEAQNSAGFYVAGKAYVGLTHQVDISDVPKSKPHKMTRSIRGALTDPFLFLLPRSSSRS